MSDVGYLQPVRKQPATRRDVREHHISAQPVVYISGPIRAGSFEKVLDNISQAEILANKFINAGLPVILVHSQARVWYARLNDPSHRNLIIAEDQALVARCDVIAFVRGWEKSEGCQLEKKTAEEMGLEMLENEEAHDRFIQHRGFTFDD